MINKININIEALDKKMQKALNILKETYDFEIKKTGKKVFFEKIDDKKIIIDCDKEKILIKSPNTSGFFRSLSEVIKNKDLEEFKIEKSINFKMNGVMFDCSRNGVLSVKYIKELIKKLAFMGHNTFLLYMEDVYEIDDEPYFGYLRGRYSKKELKEIDDYAYMFSMEFIPCIQTLAHLNQFFAWEDISKKYGDIHDVLLVGDKNVDKFIEKMIKSLKETLRTNTIHLGMDEAYHLGRGKFLDINGMVKKTDIMKLHLKNLLKICKKYDVKPIIWDDMFFSGYSKISDNEKYNIDNDISLMYWDYYGVDKEHYETRIEQRKKISDNVMFAGGAWKWAGFTPHHGKTIKATNEALMVCKEKGIDRVIVTSWADDGAESPNFNTLLGATLFAEHEYNYDVCKKTFAESLEFYTGINYTEWMSLEKLDIWDSFKDKEIVVTPSSYLFYEDPLCSKFVFHSKKIKTDLTKYYEKLSKEFNRTCMKYKGNEEVVSIFKFYEIYVKLMSKKWNLGLNIYNAYNDKDKERLEEIIEKQIRPLKRLFGKMQEARLKIWEFENKTTGFEILDYRFGGLLMRLKTTEKILKDYINGKTDKIVELEDYRISATSKDAFKNDEAVFYHSSDKSMSTSKMIW